MKYKPHGMGFIIRQRKGVVVEGGGGGGWEENLTSQTGKANIRSYRNEEHESSAIDAGLRLPNQKESWNRFVKTIASQRYLLRELCNFLYLQQTL